MPFWPTPLFKSQLIKDGEDFLLKKATPKIHRVLDSIRTNPFVVPTTAKRGSYRKRSYGRKSSQSSNQSFSSGRGKSNGRGFRGRLRPHSRGREHGNPLQASLSSNQSFSSGRGKSNGRGFRGRLRPHSRGRGHGHLTSLPQSTGRRSPPFFQKRLANKQMFSNVLNIITNGYVLPFISKPKLFRAPLI